MPEMPDTWTVLQLINWSTNYLSKKGVENARLNAERLISHTLKVNRVGLYLDFDRPLLREELRNFKRLLLRRASREPLQYIIGETEFYSLPFKVRPGVLIPRPETEFLVESVLSAVEDQNQHLHILDAGTGSGIIGVTLAKYLPNTKITAIDISEDALKVANENAALNQVEHQVQFVLSAIEDWKSFLPNNALNFDFIAANPPYILPDEKDSLEPEVIEFEPVEALITKADLSFYRSLFDLAKTHLNPRGKIYCEIGPSIQKRVALLLDDLNCKEYHFLKDYAGRSRVVVASFH